MATKLHKVCLASALRCLSCLHKPDLLRVVTQTEFVSSGEPKAGQTCSKSMKMIMMMMGVTKGNSRVQWCQKRELRLISSSLITEGFVCHDAPGSDEVLYLPIRSPTSPPLMLQGFSSVQCGTYLLCGQENPTYFTPFVGSLPIVVFETIPVSVWFCSSSWLASPPPPPPPILQGFGSAQCGTYVARRTPYASPCMSEVCLVLSLKQFLCVGLICYSSVLPSRGTSWKADFFHASLLKAVVLGFVATDSISSSWAHQIFHSINNKPLLVVAVPNKSVCLGISIDSII